MTLKDKVMNDLKSAMKNKDKVKLSALRDVKAAILLKETEKGNKIIEEADELKLLQKLVKQRKDSAEVYKNESRDDLADKEMAEAKVIEDYLPESISDEKLRDEIQKIIDELGAESMKDMGKVMSVANKKFAGKAEGQKIASVVKELLS